MKHVVVGYSGGVTSAWCAMWALMTFPKDTVTFLFHDTKEEDEDTYRFLREFAAKLNHPIVERSDGRSVAELEEAEHMLANDRVAFCSRILKAEQREKYFEELRHQAFFEGKPTPDILLILGFTANEERRIQKHTMEAEVGGYRVDFPLARTGTIKQVAADFIQCSIGITLPRMYEWSGHSNCVGCRRGGLNYWWQVKQHRPDVFNERATKEREFGHSHINGVFLDELTEPQKYADRESIEVGSCGCGD